MSYVSAVPAVGLQRPRICLVPDAEVTDSGDVALELCALAGLDLDPWQVFVLVSSLGERADGKWAAFEVGMVVPRQNGKGTLLEARELFGLFACDEERLIIHSAHEQITSSEHQRRLLDLIEGVPEFEQKVLRAPRGKGMEAIELRDGSRILFKTRTAGGGRGLTGDLVVLDEAMIITLATTATLIPTMAARSIVGNPQIWYTGSSVDQSKHEHGVVLSRVRERGITGEPRLMYVEWSAEGDDPSGVPESVRSDPDVWALANPGLGIRIGAEYVADESRALGSREFCVERLGIGDWPATEDMDGRLFQPGVWLGLTDVQSTAADPVCFAVDVSPDRSSAAISVAGRRPDGRWHVEVVDHRKGTEWVVPRAVALTQRHKHVGPVVDGVGPAAALVPEFAEAGVEVRMVKTQEYVQACGQLYDHVIRGTLRHLGTDELATAVDGASRRPLGDAWALSRKDSQADITPLVSATLARWGAETLPLAVDVAANIH